MRLSTAFRLASCLFVPLVVGCGGGGVTPPVDCVQAGTCLADLATAATPDMSMKGCSPACAAPNPVCTPAGQCVACLADADCPAGQVCGSSLGNPACVPGCKDDARCAGLGGSFRCCANACVDVSRSAAHCGRCGAPCSPDHGVGGCNAGACSLTRCLPGWGDCDGKADNGCEANLHIDKSNCGMCGAACSIPNAISACADGCYLSACQFGWDDCDGDAKNGCERSVLNDAKNCGACGQSCSGLPHAAGTCQTGVCVFQCDQGWGDCDGNQMNGCETNTGTDAKSCGKCGNACPQGLVCQNSSCTCPQCNFPNAKSQCVNNQCMLDACFAGYANCDGNPANGCEVDLNFDDKNCGACGVACPMNNPRCSGGVCTNLPVLVGKFNVSDGPAWGGNPPTYTCQEACAKVFGGTANQYQCSTVMGSVNRMANTSIWGVGGCAVVADTFKKGTTYNCGAANCAQSAYVTDNCSPGPNYCFK